MSLLDDEHRHDEEKRRGVRRPIHINSVVYDPKTRLRTSVSIINLSQKGAALRCADPVGLSDAFILLIQGSDDMQRECVVVWRTSREVGVRFRDR